MARHIPLDDSPTQVISAVEKPLVYALTPATGAIHEIQVYRLSVARKASVASSVVSMALAPDERSLYVLAREPKALISVATESFRPNWSLRLPEDPVDFAISDQGNKAAISSGNGVWLADLDTQRLSGPLWKSDFGALRFLSNGKTLIAANRTERVLSLFETAEGRLIAHLPVSVQPDQLCFSPDGGQLFVTGAGMDAVVIVYPYRTEVAETVLAGHAPGAMAASASLLFIASPQSGDVNIVSIATHKVIGLVEVGADPGFVAITPDDRYALVLNRKSGDVAVLRVGAITPNRNKSAGLLTVIPVGSRPVSAAVHRV